MGDLIKGLVAILSGGTGAAVGGLVANVAAFTALVAAATPIWLGLVHHKDEAFLIVTYGQLAFYGGGFGVFLFAVIKLVHYTRPPQ